MKKTKIFIALLLLLASMSLFLGCTSSKIKSDDKLLYNSKYINQYNVREDESKQTYFLFNKDGTGEYVNYNLNRDAVSHYKIGFKYVLVDESTVVCMYDSQTMFDDHTDESKILVTWSLTLAYSEDLLLSVQNNLYINQNYLKNIENFGKK